MINLDDFGGVLYADGTPIKLGAYLTATELRVPPHITTRRWLIQDRRGYALGVVAFYAGWRQYVFQPETGCEFNDGCLTAIAYFLTEITRKHREDAAARHDSERTAPYG